MSSIQASIQELLKELDKYRGQTFDVSAVVDGGFPNKVFHRTVSIKVGLVFPNIASKGIVLYGTVAIKPPSSGSKLVTAITDKDTILAVWENSGEFTTERFSELAANIPDVQEKIQITPTRVKQL